MGGRTRQAVPVKERNPRVSRKEYQRYLDSARWKIIRGFILDRDGGTCRLCNGTAGGVQVHHRVYNLYHETLADLITLCDTCHALFSKHRRLVPPVEDPSRG